MAKQETKSGYVIAEEKPLWVDSESESKIKENGFAEIRTFFSRTLSCSRNIGTGKNFRGIWVD